MSKTDFYELLGVTRDADDKAVKSAFRKLAIHLPAVTQTTLAVYAVPLAAGEDPPTTLPPPTPLANWPMTGTSPPRALTGTATGPENAADVV